jgi:hypothetical protein
MSARPAARVDRALVRVSQRSRLEPQCWSSAYELALPIIRRVLAERFSAKPQQRTRSYSVAPKCLGGSS